MAADNRQATRHHALHILGNRFRSGLKQLDRQRAVPYAPVRRAVDRLILRPKELLDLIVGSIDRPRAAGFVLALAAEL